MSIRLAIAPLNHVASSSVLNEKDGFSNEELANLTRIRDEFLEGEQSTHSGNGPWKTVAELIRAAFAPDHTTPIPKKSTQIFRKERNEDSDGVFDETVLIHRIVKGANGLRTNLGNCIREKGDQNIDDILQHCINWLIGVKPCDKACCKGIKYSDNLKVITGRIRLSFYPYIKCEREVPSSQRLATPTYATVDFFVYNFLKPVIEQTAFVSTGKRRRKAVESFEPNKKTKLDEAEPSSSSSSQPESSAPSLNNVLNPESLLPPPGSFSSSSPLAPSLSFGSSLIFKD